MSNIYHNHTYIKYILYYMPTMPTWQHQIIQKIHSMNQVAVTDLVNISGYFDVLK